MKNLFYIALAMVMALSSCSESPTASAPESNYSLIPEPQNLIPSEGTLHLRENFSINAPIELESAQRLLTTFLEDHVGLIESEGSATFRIHLSLDTTRSYQNEGYLLVINQDGVALTSNTAEGVHRGLATLMQLILLNTIDDEPFLPYVTIDDWAGFAHRGLLLDCSRHFFQVGVIKKYIDLLAFYKMNTLHWHLTEDQGWRIAIEKYPKLIEVGAYRTEPDGSTYGGYYSKEEIKEIVAYASARHIEVIPEIELPGHSQAAIAAYPHLSCKGDQVAVANDWGVFKEIYCAGNDSVFVFLEDVLTEVMELFPSQYIHIGGDEAPKVRWAECNKCRRRLKDEGLADEAELQSYFIRRVQRFLQENGKQIIGWDEILEGGLAEGAIVQSWRGMEGGVEAVRHGNQAIMSPTSHAYFDYALDAIDLEKVYSFNPIPQGLTSSEQELIIGGECNMWTERVPDEKTLDSRVFPRLLAMAEVLWSDSTKRDFSEFTERVQSHYPILEMYHVQYGKESVAMSHEMELDIGVAYLRLIPYSEAITLKYRYDCPNCEATETEYSSLIPIQKSGTIGIQPYKNDQPYGDSIFVPVSQHKAVNAEVTYHSEFSKWYTAGGENGLVDSKLGTLNFRDGSWQGFWGKDLECTVRLYAPTEVSSVTAHFYQYNNSWIFIPTEMSVDVSADGKNWISWGTIKSGNDPKKRGKYILPLSVTVETVEPVTFIRLTAKNLGVVPDWHEAAGSDAWIFIDEIIAE
ncbi:beta-N-acetylhexosaminidase [Cryomorphaceae bacterium 1068]|nr:beta-N-acetylhexosaminidase [Cryomorphaceae bacterium 1068]